MPRGYLTDYLEQNMRMPMLRAPGDMTEQSNTALPPEMEQQFQTWQLQAARDPRLRNLMGARDFDIRGAWLAAMRGDPRVSWLVGVGTADARGHLPDQWKKPNHPTFSDGSQYQTAGVTGGIWKERPGGAWDFNASPTNMRMQPAPNALRSYMQRNEPTTRFVEPAWSMLK